MASVVRIGSCSLAATRNCRKDTYCEQNGTQLDASKMSGVKRKGTGRFEKELGGVGRSVHPITVATIEIVHFSATRHTSYGSPMRWSSYQKHLNLCRMYITSWNTVNPSDGGEYFPSFRSFCLDSIHYCAVDCTLPLKAWKLAQYSCCIGLSGVSVTHLCRFYSFCASGIS